MLALNLQVPLASLDELMEDTRLTVGQRLQSRHAPTRASEAKHILIVDDSVWEGRAIRKAKERLAGHPVADRVIWGALYSRRGSDPALLDTTFAFVGTPRAFQWNILHHTDGPLYCMDMDGVLCRDPEKAQNDDGAAYDDFLRNAVARNIPTTEIGWIVTARLEKYRPQTEEWLRAHGVRYRELIMHPAQTAAERQSRGDHAAFKADAYRRVGALLFIESDADQAREISAIAKMPVFCTDTQAMIYPHGDSSTGHQPTRIQRTRWRARNALYRNIRAVKARMRR